MEECWIELGQPRLPDRCYRGLLQQRLFINHCQLNQLLARDRYYGWVLSGRLLAEIAIVVGFLKVCLTSGGYGGRYA